MLWLREFSFFLFISCDYICNGAVILQETVMGVVGSKNYSYYLLSQPGNVFMFLHTYKGDADLYVMVGNGKPTYELDKHDFQSVTCGFDYVQVPYASKRPLSIAIYGHPSFDVSIFELQIVIDDSIEEQPLNSYDSDENNVETNADTQKPQPKLEPKKEQESFFWTLILGMLKVLFDILLE